MKCVEQFLGAEVEIECFDIPGRLLDRRLFRGRKLRLELAGYCLGDLALNGEGIRQLAIVLLSPQMSVGARVNQLRQDLHAVCRALHAAFQEMGYSKLSSNFPHVPRTAALVHHYGRATDDF